MKIFFDFDSQFSIGITSLTSINSGMSELFYAISCFGGGGHAVFITELL